MANTVATSSRPVSFFTPMGSPLVKGEPLLEKKDSFVNVLQSPHTIKQALPLQKETTHAQALQASKDVMQTFYTQFLKMMFENLNGEDDDSLYQNEMLRGMLAENISKTLSQKVTPMHEKIAGVMLKNNTKEDPLQKDGDPLRSSTSLAASAA